MLDRVWCTFHQVAGSVPGGPTVWKQPLARISVSRWEYCFALHRTLSGTCECECMVPLQAVLKSHFPAFSSVVCQLVMAILWVDTKFGMACLPAQNVQHEQGSGLQSARI